MVLKFAYLKNLEDVNQFNISRLDKEKEGEQGNGGVDVTTVINYKTPIVVNRKPATVSLALGEVVAFNTIFHDHSCKHLSI